MGSLPQDSKSYPSYPPFKNTGTLDAFKQVHITPCLGSEFRDVDVSEWLEAPNSDDMLRDLTLTREHHIFKTGNESQAHPWLRSRRAGRGLLSEPEQRR